MLKNIIFALLFISTTAYAQSLDKDEIKEQKRLEREEKRRVRDSIAAAQDSLFWASIYARQIRITDTCSFLLQNNEIVWRKVFETELSHSELAECLISSNDFFDINILGSSQIVGKMKGRKVNYEQYGYSRMKIPIYISNDAFGPGFFNIEWKEGKYRVTLKDIMLTSMIHNGLSPYGSQSSLSALVIKNDSIVEAFYKYAHMYDDMLTKLFTVSKIEDEW